MKKIISWLLVCAMILSVGGAALFSAAADDEPVCTLTPSETELLIKVGQSATVDCAYAFSAEAYSGCSFSWKVKNTSITVGRVGVPTRITAAAGSFPLTLKGERVGDTEVTVYIKKTGATAPLAEQTLHVTVWNDPMQCDIRLSDDTITIPTNDGRGTFLCSYTLSGDGSDDVLARGVWSSTDDTVVSMDYGHWMQDLEIPRHDILPLTLIGRKAGTVTGTVTLYDTVSDAKLGQKTIQVTVTPTFTPAIHVSDTTLNLLVGQTSAIRFGTVPSDQTVIVSAEQGNNKIVNFTQSGQTVKIIGKETGTEVFTLRMSYNGTTYTKKVTVNVTAPALRYIAVSKAPNKTQYRVGESLDTTGMEVLAGYSGGTQAYVTAFTCSPLDTSTPGTKTVTVSYTEGAETRTASFAVDVTSDEPYTLYVPVISDVKAGDTVDVPVNIDANAGVKDLRLQVSYDPSLTLKGISNGTVFAAEQMKVEDHPETSPCVISWDASADATGKLAELTFEIAADASAGQKTITASAAATGTAEPADVTFAPCTGSVCVADPETELRYIFVSQTPDKTEYSVNKQLDPAGMIVTAVYSDGSCKTVNGWTYSPRTLTESGRETITVLYRENGKAATATFGVDVKNGLDRIEFKNLPTKREYVYGERLDLSGLEVRAVYADGSKALVDGWSCPSVVLNSVGTQEITVSYTQDGETVTGTFTVQVKDVFESIAVTEMPTKQAYFVGETLDTAGMTVMARYRSGATATVTGWTCSPEKMEAKGRQRIVVSYTEDGVNATASFTVNVTDPLQSIELTEKPTKLRYLVGETLDTSGMVVTAKYRSGATATVTGWNCTSVELNEMGVKEITVTYSEGNETATAVFSVQVVPDDTIPVTGVKFEFPDPINMFYKDKREFCLKATVYPRDATNPNVIYTSDHPDVVSVDENGRLSALKRGSARITATTEDGGYTASYRVDVTYTLWQWFVMIFLFGWIWY